MITTVLLTENTLTDHDVARLAHLHDPEPVRIHVVIPARDDRSEFAEAVDDITRADFSDALRDEDAGETEAQLEDRAEGELRESVAKLKAAGVPEVDGEVVRGHPVDAVVPIFGRLDADEVVVLTEPHLIADWTRRDWASQLRRHLDKPVLHIVSGTDQVVS